MAQIDLSNVSLICDKKNRERYACGHCGQLSIKAHCLNCDSKYHSRNLTLYCQSCSLSINTTNKCPIDNHVNPKFHEAIIPQIEIEQTIEFMCPFSTLCKNNIHNTQNQTNNMINSVPNQNISNNKSCHWTGIYNDLLQHVKICPCKPIKCLFNVIDNEMNQFSAKLNEIIPDEQKKYMDEKIDKLTAETQQMLTIIALQNKKFIEQIHTLKQSNEKIKKHIKKLNNNTRLVMFVTIIVLLIAVIFGVIYDLQQQISSCHNLSHKSFNNTVHEHKNTTVVQEHMKQENIIDLKYLLQDTEMDDAKPIELTVWSHKGHYNADVPDNIIKLGYESIYRKKHYCSRDGVTRNDWIIFSVQDKNMLYFPSKIQIKTRDSTRSPKYFTVCIGVSSIVKQEWIQLHDEIFIAEHSTGVQEFDLNIDDIKWKNIQKQKYRQFKLEIIDNYGAADHICIKEFKILAFEFDLSHG